VEKGTFWAVPRFLSVTQCVPKGIVVVLTGDHFGFVMLAFLVSAFAVETTEETPLAGDASFTGGAVTVRAITGRE